MDDRFFQLQPDMILCTHAHADHMDLQTLERWLNGNRPVTFLGPRSVWEVLRCYGNGHNFVLLEPGSRWTFGGLSVCAVAAAHSDPCAIGVLLRDGSETVYVTGDTLYSTAVLAQLPPKIDRVVLPVNGTGNNMNFADAARFADDCGAGCAIPVHWGLVDALDASQWEYPRKQILEIFKEVK